MLSSARSLLQQLAKAAHPTPTPTLRDAGARSGCGRRAAWPEFCDKHEHQAPAVPKIGKAWETNSLKDSCDAWASRQLGPPGPNGEPNARAKTD
ncbi:hypothetical protein FOA52_013593 [Chlamydomonas sp. UWO 241]|nr:hypothetical protein FOA52_013593 [Chlamydomonas sp. UWO 241]